MDARIDELQREGAARPEVIGLGGGLPSAAQFPRVALARAFVRSLNQQGAPGLQYGWPEGLESLRTRIADRLTQRGARVKADSVIITNGAQQAIALACDLVCRPRSRIGVDAETYPAALDLFATRKLVAVPSEGARGLSALYCMPAVGNPRGRALTGDQRRALLRARLPIIEDDAYADLRFDGPPGPPLLAEAPGRVLHVGTFSKTLCPGLRLGYLVVPPRLRARALRLKHGGDLQPVSLSQEIVDHYLGAVDFERRLQTLRRFYRRRAGRLQRALNRYLPGWRHDPPEGGFAIWVETDHQVDEVAFLERAIDGGVSFDPGSMFRPDHRPSPTALRLAFSFVDEAQLDEGVKRLAAVWAGLRATVRRAPGARRTAAARPTRTVRARSPLPSATPSRSRA